MKPKKPAQSDAQDDLFRSELIQILNPQHALVRLSQQIPWEALDQEFGEFYVEEMGSPGKPTRLMVGLHYLKYLFNLSDEVLVERWVENPYYQYLCGEKYFQHEFPIHPTSLTKWRQRVGEKGVERLLSATVETGLNCQAVKTSSFEKVNVDTTVQEKAVAYPTDAKLLNRMREELVRKCDYAGLVLRQRYPRVGKRLVIQAGRYFHSRKTKMAKRQIRKLRTILGRVIRDMECQIEGNQSLQDYLAKPLAMAKRLVQQKTEDTQKIYSVHAPEVECIAKGKAHKKYEFGNKVGIVTTSREGFVIGAQGFHGNPYDGHTLKASLEQTEKILQQPLHGNVFVDKGYRGHDYDGSAQVYISGRKRLTAALKKWLRKRSAIEATIGHLKQSSRLDRNYLKGKEGDRINPILCACGWNLHLILAKLRSQRPFFALFQEMSRWILSCHTALATSLDTYISTATFGNCFCT